MMYESADVEIKESDAISLLDVGGCGAFVHGLEDEFEVVRNAAVGEWNSGL